ncbi:PREDICTED: uncharacterized protein LOC106120600 [Papilio xuthus]|uniref:Uncharacterized protein LOC106120600 n=1 Tax=Papilio xuthus TaxID=66420 RepID=A0AAJ7EC36_PAPXU|nr:PREDICTED: uncharacterized protein LOC106120600 [Papilio xuthus]
MQNDSFDTVMRKSIFDKLTCLFTIFKRYMQITRTKKICSNIKCTQPPGTASEQVIAVSNSPVFIITDIQGVSREHKNRYLSARVLPSRMPLASMYQHLHNNWTHESMYFENQYRRYCE